MQKYYDFMHHHYILTQINVYSYEKVSFYHSLAPPMTILLFLIIQFNNSFHILNLVMNQNQKPKLITRIPLYISEFLRTLASHKCVAPSLKMEEF